MNSFWGDVAAWVQAVGTVAALIGAAWVAAGESRAARRREEQALREAQAREARALAASRTAALNLAILAATQIHELHTLLRDETRRGRVVRVSPSRTVATSEQLLTAFPIQSLNDADAMVAFAYFPGALAMAEEVYANLEAAVRAASADQHGAIFTEYGRRMARIDRTAQERLTALKAALGQDPAPAAELRQVKDAGPPPPQSPAP